MTSSFNCAHDYHPVPGNPNQEQCSKCAWVRAAAYRYHEAPEPLVTLEKGELDRLVGGLSAKSFIYGLIIGGAAVIFGFVAGMATQ